ncbi:MAG: FAD-dependent oxidoreductase [Pseudohongiellaceae bacterium]
MQTQYRTQIAIIGGGICGLWLLNTLTQRGYACVLMEQESLGGEQTLASQGMIHGGIKYALTGFTTPSSESIAGMPARWHDCINGVGDPDLTNINRLSSTYYLFSDKTLTSRITTFFGSRTLRGRVTRLQRTEHPTFFSHEAFKGIVYRLQDMVIDTVSLVESLTTNLRYRILQSSPVISQNPDGSISGLALAEGIELEADYYILAAGKGNAALLANTPLARLGMQTRPLHQVLIKKAGLPPLYAHGISLAAGTKPRVTITTHERSDGDTVWYLGGNLAETGVDRTSKEQIAFAQQEIHALFPWVDLRDAQWRTLVIDRAEAANADGSRPDIPFCKQSGNTIVCWPTKLTLTPLVSDYVIAMLAPLPHWRHKELLPPLQTPGIGRPPWETCF